ncbi:hypothetical protein RAD16_05230 [Bradyrhizobium sp. 18BD]
MNKLVAVSIAAATPVPSSSIASNEDDPELRAARAYASWLFYERRLLCRELWPHMGATAEKFVWADNAGADWHFSGRGELAWDEGPQPSSRAAAVLDLVGIDWRKPKDDLGLDHSDTGERPALPAGWPNVDPVIELSRRAIAAYEAMDANSSSFDGPERIVSRWERANPEPLDASGQQAWKDRRKVVEDLSGLTAAIEFANRLDEKFKIAMKAVRETQPISLRGLAAKVQALYRTEVNIENYFTLADDLRDILGETGERLPDIRFPA